VPLAATQFVVQASPAHLVTEAEVPDRHLLRLFVLHGAEVNAQVGHLRGIRGSIACGSVP